MSTTPHPNPDNEEPVKPVSEDSVPQDPGTDNRWQMEPLEDAPDAPDNGATDGADGDGD